MIKATNHFSPYTRPMYVRMLTYRHMYMLCSFVVTFCSCLAHIYLDYKLSFYLGKNQSE